MGRSAAEIIKTLKKDSPEVFADVKKISLPEVDLSKINDMTAPSDMKKMTEAVKRKRLNAKGLSDVDLEKLMRRIGK